MKLYRCRICGETYLGTEPPSHCPFCGAHHEFMIESPKHPQGDWNDVELTEVEHADLEAAVELERSNTRFYLAMAAHKDDDALSSAYKRLAKVEAEHCSLFCKLLKRTKPADLMQPSEASDSWLENIEESLRRETRASALYAEFSARATNDRVIEVFRAVSAIERDHIELDGVAKGYV
jgi:rubrerythrin/rubredoxin